MKKGNTLLEVDGSPGRPRDSLLTISRSLHPRSVDKRKSDPDGLALLVAEVPSKKNCLIFCANKRNFETMASLLCPNLESNQLLCNTLKTQFLEKLKENVKKSDSKQFF